ncbi:hypothetical protein [Salibacterium aidingense]|uniref:hypothetical protein n=1 Tax=Salibacterium aidingense TaxID=384933 RepID=UPI000A004369|nr:hypothetical protein [Salibacterium aidingense]
MESNVKLIEYSDTFKKHLSTFHLPGEQLKFTSLPLEKIDNPEVSKTSTHILIMNNDTPVGFFALEEGEKVYKYSNNPMARVLTSFSIDSGSQGKGLAKRGLKLLPSFVKEVSTKSSLE